MKHTPIIFLLLLAAMLPACGTSIGSALHFKPNKTPTIDTFTADYIGTGNFDKDRLYSGMPFMVTVVAQDPENKTLAYSLDSDQGTFENQTATETGITATFYTGAISGGDSVKIHLTVTDPKKAGCSTTLDIGSGKTGPGVSFTVPAESAITPSGSTTLSFSVDCAGSYRVYVDNNIDKRDDAVIGTDVTLYNDENADITVPLLGPEAGTAGGAVKLTKGANKIWFVFQDSLRQTESAGCAVIVEGDNPYIVSTSPGNGETGIGLTPEVRVLFSKALNAATVTASSVYMTDAAGGAVAGSTGYDLAANTVTFTPSASLAYSSLYTVTLTTAITDTIGTGNPLLTNTGFTFTTAAEGSIPNPVLSPIAGTYTGAQSVALTCGTADAVILYTTNGTVPTITKNADGTFTPGNGTIYSGTPLTVAENTTVTALAYKNQFTASGKTTAVYKIRAEAPVFNASLDANGKGGLSISCATANATIRYTIDGTDPVLFGSTLGAGQIITIARNMTVRAVAVCGGLTNSIETAKDFYVSVSAPAFSVSATQLSENTDLYLSSDSGATIYYIINDPDTSDSLDLSQATAYSAPIALTGATNTTKTWRIKAIAVKDGLKNSSVISKTYTVDFGTVGEITFSPGGGTYNAGQIVEVRCATEGAEIECYSIVENSIIVLIGSGISPITVYVDKTITLRAVASKGSMTSLEYQQGYIITPEKPVITCTTPSASITGTSTDNAFTADQTVSITSATPGTTLHYTVTTYANGDGTGTPSATEYTAASTATVLVDRTMLITAWTTKSGWTDSDAASVTYYRKVAAPTIALASDGSTGSDTTYYSTDQTAVITCPTSGAGISYTKYYTSNGTKPTTSSTPTESGTLLSSGTVGVTRSTLLNAKGTKTGLLASDDAEAVYLCKVARPTLGRSASGSTVYVTMNSDTPSAAVKYATSTSGVPTDSAAAAGTSYSSIYSYPVGSATRVKAIATREGWVNSEPGTLGDKQYLYIPYSKGSVYYIKRFAVNSETGGLLDSVDKMVLATEDNNGTISDTDNQKPISLQNWIIDPTGSYIGICQASCRIIKFMLL